MSRYSFIQQPNPLTSPVTGAATRLVPTSSFAASTQMPVPLAAAAAPAAAGGVKALGAALLAEVVGNLIAGGIKSGSEIATGAFAPPETQGGSGSKFMITLQDVRDIQQYVNNENFKRRALGMPPLDADEIIREREDQLRRSAAEAGAREYAIEQLKQQGTIQSALSQAAGQGSQALSGAIQGGAQSLGGVVQQGIASSLNRPDYGSIISEIGRGF